MHQERSTKASASALRSSTLSALSVRAHPLGSYRKQLTVLLPSDAASRAVIPSMPPLSPHVSLERHLRHILPLLTLSGTSATQYKYTSNNDMHVACTSDLDKEGGTDMVSAEAYFRRYTAAVEQAKHSEREMSEVVFEEALEAGEALKGM